MGGLGSGRHTNIDCTDDCRSIDIRFWHRQGLLEFGLSFTTRWSRNGETIAKIDVNSEGNRLMLSYYCRSNGSDWQYMHYPIHLQTTPCHYGGKRYWFTCPATNCSKRVAVMYLGDRYFACRKCCQLVYQSQRESMEDRAIRKVDKIREFLEWEPGFLNGRGWKPKGMHWKTFNRLYAEHDKLVNQAMSGYSEKFGYIFRY